MGEKKELKRLKKELWKKKEKKKKKKEKKSEARDSDLSEDDFKALADIPAEDSEEELYRFFEEKTPEDKERKRNSSGKSKSSSKSRSRGRWSSGEKSGGERREKEGKEKTKKKKKLALEDLEFDLQKLQASTDEESLDLLEKMRKKNQKMLKRMK